MRNSSNLWRFLYRQPVELDLCERCFMFSESRHTVASGKLCFLMYSLRSLFSIFGFVVFVQAKDLSSFLFVLHLGFFFSSLWHLFNKKKPSNLLEKHFLSFIHIKIEKSFVLFKMVFNGSTKTLHLNWTSSIYEEQSSQSRGLRTTSTMSHAIVENTHGLARVGVGFFMTDGSLPYPAVCRATLCGATSPRHAENSCSSCLCLRHLCLPAMVSRPSHPSAHASLLPTRMRVMFPSRIMSMSLQCSTVNH